jgi:hypothetical protein
MHQQAKRNPSAVPRNQLHGAKREGGVLAQPAENCLNVGDE